MDATVELLDRQVAFLLRQPDDISFLLQLDPFLRALSTDPRLSAYLDDCRAELIDLREPMEDIDRDLTGELVELRNELVALRPSADDSGTSPPGPEDGSSRTPSRVRYEATLAFFDEFAASQPGPFNADGEGGTAGALLKILQSKDRLYQLQLQPARIVELDSEGTEIGGPEPAVASEEAPPGAEEVDEELLDAWRKRVANVDRRYHHARRHLRMRAHTSAVLALLKLEQARDALNPSMTPFGAEYDSTDAANDMLLWVGSAEYSLFKAVDGQQLTDVDVSIVADRVAELRLAVERLHEELRRRIGVTRSRLAMVNRFKLRCEWHDRERLTRVPTDADLPGGPEDRLTGEFARYLFDQGLSPLTKPLAGGLQPDLLDPLASFYVEAKQYDSSGRGDIVKGVAQVLDTVSRLRGGPYAVEEAFCVIFRRGGAYYDLPRLLRTETFTVHLLLIDVAPPEETGRRQTATPVRIPAEEFIAEYTRLTDAATGADDRGADRGAADGSDSEGGEAEE